MIEGKAVTLGGREFVVPPVAFAIMRKHADVFNGKTTPDITVMGDIVFSAISRNYPDITQDEFEASYLDIGNMKDAFNAAMRASGAEAASGEATPGSQ